jgi:uncharacterized membrane protein
MAERIDQTVFNEENLIVRLTDALEHLKTAVENKNLPSYMIPQKNLIENKITGEEQQLLIRKVTFLKLNAFKMVNKFFSGWCPYNYYRKIEEISLTLYNAYIYDIFVTLAFSCNTSEQLAGLYTEMYACKSFSYMRLLVVVFILISHILEQDKKDNHKESKKRKAQTMKGKREKHNTKKLKTQHKEA